MGGGQAALAAFGIAAAAIVALLFGLSLAIATAQATVVAGLSARAALVKRWSGFVLVAVGVWTLLLAAFAEFFVKAFIA